MENNNNMTMFSWVKRRVLGKGSYGTVFLASPIDNSMNIIAVKTADIRQSSSLQKEEVFLHELRDSPHIIQCYGNDISCENGVVVYNLLLEYAPGGTLADLIKYYKCIPELEVSWYSYMILMALQHVHKQGFVHCDLKPENILVFPRTEDRTLSHLKIADFGLAKNINFGIINNKNHPTLIMENCYFYHRGTPLYSSPESVFDGIHEPAMDIWSLGCIVMEMLTGKSAYSRGYSLVDLLLVISCDEDQPKLPDNNNISFYAVDFLRKCFIRDPSERWTADQLLHHPFIVYNLRMLREIGAVKNPKTEWNINPIAPTTWWSGVSLFLDPTTTQPAACTTTNSARDYRAALLKGLR